MKRLLSAFALAFAVVMTSANAQTNPDVIVGSITGISNYSVQGGVDAFSVGTTSCNIGTDNLLWIANTNEHPVIAQHAFRLHDDKFEMIGQSWLKHGFTALTGSLCDPCSGVGGSVLGVGCSDPYGSGLNGSQGGLGPKFEVNAFTGVFSYPFSNPAGSTGNSVFKRLQIATADLNSSTYPGARYFVEAHYVTQDDAAAGNQMNNASHREVSFSGTTNYSMSYVGNTVREEPAIFAWKNINNNVQLANFDAPNDGRFWVGFLHTDLGNGSHEWEFAIHNLNCDRSGGSFTVNLPAGATATNLGFHDVNYHSGEPFNGADWNSNVSGGQVTWSTTQTHAQNANANALRWGTLYNFRFVSNMPPQATGVSGSIGLFKPGPGGNTVPINFTAPNTMTILAGNDQSTNTGEAFGDNLELEVTIAGVPTQGITVNFAKTGGSANVIFPAGASAVTDAQGRVSVPVTSTTLGGDLEITATAGPDSSAIFNLYVRRFSSTWIPSAGILVMSVQHGQANVPFTMAIDDASYGPVNTIYGALYTSIISPSSTFYAETGDIGAASFATYRPNLVTNLNGTGGMNYLGLQSLAGSGISLNHQAYAISSNNGQLDVWLSNPIVRTY